MSGLMRTQSKRPAESGSGIDPAQAIPSPGVASARKLDPRGVYCNRPVDQTNALRCTVHNVNDVHNVDNDSVVT